MFRFRPVHRNALAGSMATVLLMLALGGCGDGDQPQTGAGTEERPVAGQWTRVADEEGAFDGAEIRSVAPGGPGLVAVGSVNSNAAVWLSEDGRSWTRAAGNGEVLGGAGDQAMFSVTAGGPGLVAVGWDGSDAAVWLSENGRSWTRASRGGQVLGGAGEQAMLSVSAGGPGLVAVGWDSATDVSDAAVWLSEDGRSWTRVPRDDKVFGGTGDQTMFSVTAGESGLVAVGWDGTTGTYKAAVWLSTNGRSWTRVTHDESVFGGAGEQAMFSVTAGGPGFVGVGYSASDAAVWLSEDGRTWTRVVNGNKVLGGAGFQEMDSVVATESGLVAVGYDGPEGEFDAAVWLSEDGRSWTRAPRRGNVFRGAGDQVMHSVTTAESLLVAVGYGGEIGDSDGAAWFLISSGSH